MLTPDHEQQMPKHQTIVLTIVLFAGALLAVLIQFFPLQKIVYVVCPWIYIPCFLYVSRHLKTWVQWVLWILFWTGSFVIRFWGIVRPFSLNISILLSIAGAIVYAIPFVVDHFTWQNRSKIAACFLFPCLNAAIDYVQELMHLGSLFGIAQTQFDNKPLLQISSVVGSKGIGFILTLFASLLIYHRKNVKRIGLCIMGILVLHLCGLVRIYIHEPVINSSEKMIVGWSAEPVVTSLDDSFFSENAEGFLEPNIEYLTKAIKKAKERDVELLCFPEECFYVYSEYRDSFFSVAQSLAKEYQMYLLLSVESDDPENEELPGYNQCLLINNQGEILADYCKAMLIPVIEEPYYHSGAGILPKAKISVEGIDITLSYGICFDGDFASYVRNIPDEAELFIDVSWDWDEVAELHYRIIGLRAVENGLTVVKPTIDGYTTVTDYLGYIHSKTHTDEDGYTDVCLVKLPLATCSTFYHRFGHYIDFLYLAGVVLLTILMIRRKKVGKKKTINPVWRI